MTLEHVAEVRSMQARTVLLVEDQPTYLSLLTDHLESQGHTIIPASSASAAAPLINAGLDFDVLITDIMMPGEINGIDLAKLVRARSASVPIILLSGFATENLFDDFGIPPIVLRKPFAPESLQKALMALARA